MQKDLQTARRQMVNQQVRAWDVLDPDVLDAIAAVPRERFVPARYQSVAYADTAIPIDDGQLMLAPKVHGRILQALMLERHHNVLEVGTGSGFLAACIARLADRVTSLEISPQLAETAGETLAALDVDNARVVEQDVYGFESDASWDAIAVTGSVPVYETRFAEWLAPGGRLFIVTGTEPLMEALLVTRRGAREWHTESLFETVVPPLVGARGPEKFVF